MTFIFCRFFCSNFTLIEQAHQELQLDYSCRRFLTNFVSNFGTREGPKTGLFGQILKKIRRRATLEHNVQYKS